MALTVGVALALAIGVLTTIAGMTRDRALYPTVTIVVGSYYALFAAMGASTEVLVVESVVGMVFLALAITGFRTSLWIAAAALAGHGLFDFVHGELITNPGMPVWWPPFCAAYDLTAAGFLAWLITSGRVRATT
ncbi:MAG: hypothetical protein EBT83_06075 [Betaproteobacteria bacterium]|jgi:hypothetical protein|nr:hypothetical protein [Betaproteobacteria bacterium]